MEEDKEMTFLTKEAILNADDIKTEVVPVPEWGGKVMIRALTGKERDSFESSMVQMKGKTREMKFDNLRARLVVLSIVFPNEPTRRMFNELEIGALGNKSAAALDRVFDAAQRLSGLRKEDVEELIKNSEITQSEDSGSDSPPSGGAQ